MAIGNASGETPTNSASSQPIVIQPLSVEEEDAIIHNRITNDERPLRRVLKKFHNYTALAHAPIVPPVVPLVSGASSNIGTVEDAREAFLVELASFHLLLKKSVMICEAEARQVEEYQRERQRIEDEHGKLRGQIEQLKTSLEHEQTVRRRKIEYDLVAEKVNTLPSRDELQQSIESLENDMLAIRTEHETQNRTIQGQKNALDGIIGDLGSLRLLGKDREVGSIVASPFMTPGPEGVDAAEGSTEDTNTLSNNALGLGSIAIGTVENGEVDERDETEDGKPSLTDMLISASLNPAAKPFNPTLQKLSAAPSPAPYSKLVPEDDIEMGEVEEHPKSLIAKGKKKFREDLEEGEASDSSSALSDPPDD